MWSIFILLHLLLIAFPVSSSSQIWWVLSASSHMLSLPDGCLSPPLQLDTSPLSSLGVLVHPYYGSSHPVLQFMFACLLSCWMAGHWGQRLYVIQLYKQRLTWCLTECGCSVLLAGLMDKTGRNRLYCQSLWLHFFTSPTNIIDPACQVPAWWFSLKFWLGVGVGGGRMGELLGQERGRLISEKVCMQVNRSLWHAPA